MEEPWLIVLAPESQLHDLDALDTLLPLPAETVAKALEACPILSREGWTFRSALVEDFDLAPEGVRFLAIQIDDPLPVAQIAECVARAAGPVTIVDPEHSTRTEVKPGAAPEAIAARIWESTPAGSAPSGRVCGQCRNVLGPEGGRCPLCGWDSAARRRPSLDPPAFAPGRPEKRVLPPLRTTLFWATLLCLVGIPSAAYKGVRGFLGCDPRPIETADPAEGETESAILFAHIVMTSDKRPELTPEGWIEVADAPEPASPMVSQAMNGRSFVADAWKNPIHCVRRGGMFTYRSFGPNGKREPNGGDDIVRSFPAR